MVNGIIKNIVSDSRKNQLNHYEPFLKPEFFDIFSNNIFSGIHRINSVSSFDMYEDDNENLNICIPVSGFSKEEISVYVDSFDEYDELRIDCHSENIKEQKKKIFYSKNSNSTLKQTIRLPYRINSDSVSAKVQNGELIIVAEKAKKQKDNRRKVEIE